MKKKLGADVKENLKAKICPKERHTSLEKYDKKPEQTP